MQSVRLTRTFQVLDLNGRRHEVHAHTVITKNAPQPPGNQTTYWLDTGNQLQPLGGRRFREVWGYRHFFATTPY